MIDYVISEEKIKEVIDCCRHPSIASIWEIELRSYPLSEHDAQVAKKNRMKVLHELWEWAKPEFNELDDGHLHKCVYIQASERLMQKLIKMGHPMRSNKE